MTLCASQCDLTITITNVHINKRSVTGGSSSSGPVPRVSGPTVEVQLSAYLLSPLGVVHSLTPAVGVKRKFKPGYNMVNVVKRIDIKVYICLVWMDAVTNFVIVNCYKSIASVSFVIDFR